MPRHYEAVYIFDSTLEDAAINEKLTRHHALLGTAEQPVKARELLLDGGVFERGVEDVDRLVSSRHGSAILPLVVVRPPLVAGSGRRGCARGAGGDCEREM